MVYLIPTKKYRVVGVDERNNRCFVTVKSYKDINWNDLKMKVNSSHRGYIFFIVNESDYHFEVDTPIVRFASLDEYSPTN